MGWRITRKYTKQSLVELYMKYGEINVGAEDLCTLCPEKVINPHASSANDLYERYTQNAFLSCKITALLSNVETMAFILQNGRSITVGMYIIRPTDILSVDSRTLLAATLAYFIPFRARSTVVLSGTPTAAAITARAFVAVRWRTGADGVLLLTWRTRMYCSCGTHRTLYSCLRCTSQQVLAARMSAQTL